MADLTPTPLGYHTQAPDGSDVFLPEDVARTVFPDNFAAPHNDTPEALGDNSAPPPADIPVPTAPGEAPSLGVSPLSPPTMPPPPPPEAGGTGLAPGESLRISHSGYGPVSKGGYVNVGSLTEPYNAIGSQYNQVAHEQQAALGQESQVRQQQANAELPIHQQEFDQAQANEKAYGELVTKAQQQLDEKSAAIQQAVNNIPNEDPNRWWNSKSGFDKTMTAITFALSGIASNGGPNQAVQLAEHLIDQDMRAQETDIATAKAKVGYAENAYARTVQNLGQMRLDEQEKYALKQATLAANLAKVAATFKSPLTQAQYMEAAAKLHEGAVKNLADAYKNQQQAFLEGVKINNDRRAQVERMSYENRDLAFREGQAEAQRKAQADYTGLPVGPSTGYFVTGPDGKPTTFRVNTGRPEFDQKLAEGLMQKGKAANKLYRALSRLKDIDFTHLRGPEHAGEIQALKDDIALAYSEASGMSLSRTSDKDIALMIDSMVGGSSKYLDLKGNDYYKKIISRSMDDIQENMSREGQAYGDTRVNWRPPVVPKEHEADGSIHNPGSALTGLQETKVDPRVPGDEDNAKAIYAKGQTTVDDIRSGRTPLPLAKAAISLLVEKHIELRDAGYTKEAAGLLQESQQAANAYNQERERMKASITKVVRGGKQGLETALQHYRSQGMSDDDALYQAYKVFVENK